MQTSKTTPGKLLERQMEEAKEDVYGEKEEDEDRRDSGRFKKKKKKRKEEVSPRTAKVKLFSLSHNLTFNLMTSSGANNTAD